MIEELEIKNFESHKNSILKFKPGLNLIVGKSDSGKTSVIRAMRLIATNDWSPESLRAGEKNAEIKIKTDKGTVEVKRGKDNIWVVKKNGSKKEEFKNIGKSILPEAAEVIGINPIKIGEIKATVNIMNQLEEHFLLSQVEGKDASGSFRAQVFDEISGLTGIEGIIREVSLDNTRNTREINRLEDEIKELDQKKYNELELEKEEKAIQELEKLSKRLDDINFKINSLKEHYETIGKINIEMERINKRLKEIPDIKLIQNSISSLEKNVERVKEANLLVSDYRDNSSTLKNLVFKIRRLPNLSKFDLNEIRSKFNRILMLTEALNEYQETLKSFNRKELVFKRMPEIDMKIFIKIERNLEKIKLLIDIIDDIKETEKEIQGKEKEKKFLEKELFEKEIEVKELMKLIKVCPITNKPLGKYCKEQMEI